MRHTSVLRADIPFLMKPGSCQKHPPDFAYLVAYQWFTLVSKLSVCNQQSDCSPLEIFIHGHPCQLIPLVHRLKFQWTYYSIGLIRDKKLADQNSSVSLVEGNCKLLLSPLYSGWEHWLRLQTWAHTLTIIVLYFKNQRKFWGETELNCQTWWCISQSSGLECSQASKFGKAFSVPWYTAKLETSTTDSTKTNSCQHYENILCLSQIQNSAYSSHTDFRVVERPDVCCLLPWSELV